MADRAKAEGNQSQAKEQNEDKSTGAVDVVDGSADTTVYPADLGYTVTSHGDGTPSISPQYVERREELAERNSDEGVDAENRAVAKRLGLLK